MRCNLMKEGGGKTGKVESAVTISVNGKVLDIQIPKGWWITNCEISGKNTQYIDVRSQSLDIVKNVFQIVFDTRTGATVYATVIVSIASV